MLRLGIYLFKADIPVYYPTNSPLFLNRYQALSEDYKNIQVKLVT